MQRAPEGRNRHQGALTLIFVMASSGVVKVILSFYRDDEGSAFERHRGRVPFDIEKHNSMEIACKHLIEFIGIKQAEKFGFGSFRSRWAGACNSHTKPMTRYFYRLIYFSYTFSFVKERQFRSSDAVTSISVLWLVMALPRESHSK